MVRSSIVALAALAASSSAAAQPAFDPFAHRRQTVSSSADAQPEFDPFAHRRPESAPVPAIVPAPALDTCNCRVAVDRGASWRRAGAVATAIGGTLGVAALALAAFERSRYDDAIRQLGGSPVLVGLPVTPASQAALNQARDAYFATHYYANGLALVGTAALATGAYLYFVRGQRREVVAPTLAPGQVGVVVARRF
jgi:hypothetical protein